MAVEDYENPIIDILTTTEDDPEWLVPDMLLQGTLMLLVGDSNVGKSYISYTLGLSIAAGVPALNSLVPAGKPRTVVYFDDENSRQDRDKYLRRIYIGLCCQNGGEEPDLGLLDQHFKPVHFALGNEDWEERATEYVEAFNPALIVFDTATPCFNIDDENSNGEAQRAAKAIRRIMRVADPVATALVLKHAKGPEERLIRGAKSWRGTADGVIFQVKARGRPRKDGLFLARLVPDKTRAYGMTQTIYLTPSYTDNKRSGLVLDASREPTREHKNRLGFEEEEEE